jgi:hypothetical protein
MIVSSSEIVFGLNVLGDYLGVIINVIDVITVGCPWIGVILLLPDRFADLARDSNPDCSKHRHRLRPGV